MSVILHLDHNTGTHRLLLDISGAASVFRVLHKNSLGETRVLESLHNDNVLTELSLPLGVLHDGINLDVLHDDNEALVADLLGTLPDSTRALGSCVVDDLDIVFSDMVQLDFEVLEGTNRVFDILANDLTTLDLGVNRRLF